ncbi:MAG: trypsin-like peptidase domain-containing protein [Deltaproteobacteria bacterium]|nr:MAG: trypsin-like peptidase domain-containing protein [Deltaproteobacteria bacterium]
MPPMRTPSARPLSSSSPACGLRRAEGPSGREPRSGYHPGDGRSNGVPATKPLPSRGRTAQDWCMFAAGVAALLLLATPAVPTATPGTLRRALHAASVQIDPPGCSGVLAESNQIVVTARHCIDAGVQKLHVRFTNDVTRIAWVVASDEAADQAVLFLEDPVDVEPLPIVRRRQIPGTVLYFEGNPSRPRFQSARLDRIGRCPSLPDLPNALFTSIAGVPGDSGAPLVDVVAEVVGLVHGGARCHIATPADTLVRLVHRVLEQDDVHMTRGLGREHQGA